MSFTWFRETNSASMPTTLPGSSFSSSRSGIIVVEGVLSLSRAAPEDIVSRLNGLSTTKGVAGSAGEVRAEVRVVQP